MNQRLRMLLLCVLAGVPAAAQNFTAVTASRIQDASGAPLTSGQLCIQGVDLTGKPATYQAGGGGIVHTLPVCTTVTNGVAATVNIANSSATLPVNIAYKLTITDNTSGAVVSSLGPTQITGSAWSLDSYQPAVATAITQVGPQGPKGDTGTASVVTTNGANGDFNVGGRLISTTGPVFDVMASAYGGKGDGSTDDRAAIQSALNAAQSVCGTVLFQAGRTFLVGANSGSSNLLAYRPCVSMTGGGTIKVASGIGPYRSLFDCSGSSSPLQPATFSDISIDMNGTGNSISTDPGTTNQQITFAFAAPSPTGYGLTLRDVKFLNGHGVWTLVTYADQITVTNCKWINWGVGSSLLYDTSLLFLAGNSAVVTGNNFSGTGLAAHTAIEVHSHNKVVTGNVITGFYAGIIYSADQNNTGTAKNILIAHNSINQTWYGIQFWAVDGAVLNLTIDGNAINIDRTYNNTGWTAGLGGGESGIETYVNTNHDISDLNIVNNTINWATEPSTYTTASFQAGIGLYTASGGTLNNANVANNIINNTPGPGIGVSLGGAAAGLHIRGNTITNPGKNPNLTTNFRAGLLFTATPSWKNSVVADNIISDTQATPTMQRGILWAGAASDGAANVFVGRNRVNYTGTPNEYFHFQTSSPLFDVLVPGYSSNAALLSLTSFTTGNYPPKFAAITDETTSRNWRNLTSPAAPPYFNSQELRDTIPTSGSYNQGDIVWAADSAIGGFAGWVNTLTGTPGTFAKIVLTNAGTNSPFTSNVAAPGFTVGSTAGVTATVACPTGQHITGLTITGGIVAAVPGCS